MSSKLITLDGPSGVGKTTIGKKLASDLNLDFISSGMIYRAIAAHFNKKGVSTINEINITSKNPIIYKIDGETYQEDELYSPEINKKSSEIAQLLEIRNIVSNILRFLYNSSANGLVVEGRDMGSVVFQDADLKIYLDASEATRSKRRLAQSGSKESIEDIRTRDSRDINRKISPLVVPINALVINNEDMTIEEIIKLIKENLKLQ
jgi:cytidylate kinase|tara:strand:+ start:1164 stop:1781 length:618 start_codon:yes stop_codon:yes gene_type:complete